MKTEDKHKLTLDGSVRYRITVPGHLDDTWMDWAGEMAVAPGSDEDGQPVTTLSGDLDQAALLGLLRRLYSLGLPLISVEYVTIENEAEE